VLDIKLIREKTEFVRARLATRGAGDEQLIGGIITFDKMRRKALADVESLKSQRNRVSKEIGALMGQKKLAEAEAKKAETKDLGEKIAALDEEAAHAESYLEHGMLQLPNLPHESVPFGKTANDNPEVRVHGEKQNYSFTIKSHVELCESLKLVDFARAAKLSGSGFLLYTNWGARLERALISFLLDLHITQHEYTEVSPPFMVGEQCMVGVGQFPKFKDQYYGVADGGNTGGQHSSRGNPGGETVADKILRLHAVLSRRGGRGGRGHARHDPRAPVRQGGADQNREAGARLRRTGKDGRKR
jgi:seryl-tRNA synthetase